MLILAFMCTFASTAVAANIQGPRRSALDKLKDGDAVRKRYQLRLHRFEIAPIAGFTLNDAYRKSIVPGITMAYHMTDSLAIGVTGAFGIQYDTDLANQLQNKRPERVGEGDFSDLKMLASAELIYTPLYGKIAVVQRLVFDYDFHIIVGGGVALIRGASELDKTAPLGLFGVGFRFFIDRWMAVTVQVRDYVYSSAVNSVVDQDVQGNAEADADTEFKNNFVFLVGYSFMFPRMPKISD